MKSDSRELVTQDCFDETMHDFMKHFNKVLERKGSYSFIGMTDVYGKLSEEVFETLKAMHEKNKEEFAYELFDVAVVSLFGVMSLKQKELIK